MIKPQDGGYIGQGTYLKDTIYTYMLPDSYHTAEQDMMVSAFYTIITPVLNTLIYSLRNKDVTGALRSRMQSGLNLRKVVKRKS